MRRHLLRMVRTLRMSAAVRWRRVRQLRSQTRTVLSDRRLRRRSGRAVAPGPGCASSGDEWLAAELLDEPAP